jgi:hypothetical protein
MINKWSVRPRALPGKNKKSKSEAFEYCSLLVQSEEGKAVVEGEKEADDEDDEVEHVLLGRRLGHVGQLPIEPFSLQKAKQSPR